MIIVRLSVWFWHIWDNAFSTNVRFWDSNFTLRWRWLFPTVAWLVRQDWIFDKLKSNKILIPSHEVLFEHFLLGVFLPCCSFPLFCPSFYRTFCQYLLAFFRFLCKSLHPSNSLFEQSNFSQREKRRWREKKMKIQSKLFAILFAMDFFVSNKIELLSIPMAYVVANHWILSLLSLSLWSFYDCYVEFEVSLLNYFVDVFIILLENCLAFEDTKSMHWMWWKCIIYSAITASKLQRNVVNGVHEFISHFIVSAAELCLH